MGGVGYPEACTARYRVAIIIPYRNREEHLKILLHHLHPVLQRQELHYGIYVINQAEETKFNRAMLFNVGYVESLKEENWDCFVFHDVDHLTEDDRNLYWCPTQPVHLAVGMCTVKDNNSGQLSPKDN